MKFSKVWKVREEVRQILLPYEKYGEVNLNGLVRTIGRLLNKRFRTKFSLSKTNSLPTKHLVISGLFNAYELDGPLLEIVINSAHQTHFDFHKEGNDSWQFFVNSISETIMHEYVHLLQYRKHKERKSQYLKTKDKDFNYFCDSDELDAYAWSLASEACDEKGLQSLVTPVEHSVYWNYFGYFQTHPQIRRKLLRKAYTRIIMAQEYKPTKIRGQRIQ